MISNAFLVCSKYYNEISNATAAHNAFSRTTPATKMNKSFAVFIVRTSFRNSLQSMQRYMCTVHTDQVHGERATPVSSLEAKDAAPIYREEWIARRWRRRKWQQQQTSTIYARDVCAARVRSLEIFWRYRRVSHSNKQSVACERANQPAVLIRLSRLCFPWTANGLIVLVAGKSIQYFCGLSANKWILCVWQLTVNGNSLD